MLDLYGLEQEDALLSGGCSVLILVAPDADAMCCCRILTCVETVLALLWRVGVQSFCAHTCVGLP